MQSLHTKQHCAAQGDETEHERLSEYLNRMNTLLEQTQQEHSQVYGWQIKKPCEFVSDSQQLLPWPACIVVHPLGKEDRGAPVVQASVWTPVLRWYCMLSADTCRLLFGLLTYP